MENYRTALAETKIHRTTGYKSPNCFQCNFLDVGFRSKMAIYAEGIWKLEQHLSYFSQVDRLGSFWKNFAVFGWEQQKIFSRRNWFNVLQGSSTRRRSTQNFGKSKYRGSRGGKTTKIHALVNEHFQLVGISLSGGNVHDSEMAIKVLSKVTLEGKKILADKGYCSEEIRNFISQEKAEVCIPDKSNAVVIHNFDKELYKSRNIIERFFQRIKNYRHVATRYDKLSNCFLNFIILAAVMIQI